MVNIFYTLFRKVELQEELNKEFRVIFSPKINLTD